MLAVPIPFGICRWFDLGELNRDEYAIWTHRMINKHVHAELIAHPISTRKQ